MLKIDQIKFGSIIIDDRRFHQVIIVGNKIIERDSKKLHELFKTSHKIGDWEQNLLIKDSPEYIIIGTGFQGALEVKREISDKLKSTNANVIILKSPVAIHKYNDLISQGKKVNALIHTTC